MEFFAHTKQRMTCKGHYRISIVLAFSCGRDKTIRMKYVWTCIFLGERKTLSVFKNSRICVDKALIMITKVYLCKSVDVMYSAHHLKFFIFLSETTPY